MREELIPSKGMEERDVPSIFSLREGKKERKPLCLLKFGSSFQGEEKRFLGSIQSLESSFEQSFKGGEASVSEVKKESSSIL